MPGADCTGETGTGEAPYFVFTRGLQIPVILGMIHQQREKLQEEKQGRSLPQEKA